MGNDIGKHKRSTGKLDSHSYQEISIRNICDTDTCNEMVTELAGGKKTTATAVPTATTAVANSSSDNGAVKCQHNVKALLLGPPKSGKTKLCRVMTGAYVKSWKFYDSTIGVDFHDYFVSHANTNIRLQFWDCSGDLVFRSVINSYPRGAQLVFLLVDLSQPDSLLEWLEQLQPSLSGSASCWLIADTKATTVTTAALTTTVTTAETDLVPQQVLLKLQDQLQHNFHIRLSGIRVLNFADKVQLNCLLHDCFKHTQVGISLARLM